VGPPGLIVDTGPLYAYVDARDAAHAACVELLQATAEPLIVPAFAIAEATYLVGTRLGAASETRLVGDFAAGAFWVDAPEPADWLRIAELIAEYRDLPLGTVDASVIAAAERLGITTIATLERKHFSIVRPNHVAAFKLVP
jgi:hypothetical protein